MNASKVFWRGVVCALAGATLWGFSGACIQFLAESYEVSSAFISAVRAGVAALLFAVFVFVTRREALLSLLGRPAARPTLVLFGVGLYLSQITYAVSVALTNAGTATVLQATCTVFVMLITCARSAPSAARRRLCRADVRDGRRDAHRHPGRLGRHRAAGGGLGWGIANALSETLYIMAPQRLYGRWDRPTIIACGMVISGIVAVLVWLIGEMIVSLLAAPSVALGAAGLILADLFGTAGSFVPDMDATGWLALVGGVGVLGTFAAFGLFLTACRSWAR
ncbi:MAG: EamA family transporter [Adlercreutzia equolifaciens]